ncbi:unnamed protein product [Owenia fusiformis]|uniref:Guanylate cyclase n=1 Tax=Owenia fusiformis TaxID=6347 RepID=A0A8S4N3Q8_OWEFU|nr:unnamed protein product [Owenia fusiformis]
MGLLVPRYGALDYVGWETNAAAATMALDKAREMQLLPGYNLSVTWRNGACNAGRALGMAVDMITNDNINTIIGPACSAAAIVVSHLATFWNFPVFSHASSDPELADKTTFQTLVRVMPPYSKMGKAFVEVFRYFNWTVGAMMSVDYSGQYSFESYAHRSIQGEFRKANIMLSDDVKVPSNISSDEINAHLERFQKRARIIILLLFPGEVKHILYHASRLGMTNGEYVFLTTFGMLPDENMVRPWLDLITPGQDEENKGLLFEKRLFESLLQITVSAVKNEESDRFREQVAIKMMDEPWNFNKTYLNGLKGSMYSLYLYDTVLVYLMTVNKTIQRGGSLSDGRLMFENAKEIEFDGKSGRVKLDKDAEREPDFWIWQLVPSQNDFTHFGTIDMDKPIKQRFHVEAEPFWKTKDRRPPLGIPVCGFYNQYCEVDNSLSDGALIGIILGVVVCFSLVLGLVILMFLRKRKHDHEKMLDMWKIRPDEIMTIKPKSKGSSGYNSVGSTNTHFSGTHAPSLGSGLLAGSWNNQIGIYKGYTVHLKSIKVDGAVLSLNKTDYEEMKIMKECNHENINPFFGICMDAKNSCSIVTLFCPKRSLEDIINNSDVKLDFLFKHSFLVDLIEGIHYLHCTKLASHGSLKSSNCLIDGRWQLKISDYGLHDLHLACKTAQGEDSEYYAKLWTAPELLRMTEPPKQGTPKGDCYSFAIILHELLFRESPYSTLELSPKDIVKRIARAENPPFRPTVPKGDELDATLMDLMYDCWQENPEFRPTCAEVKKIIISTNKGRKVNIVDRMLIKMEAYANNLEEIVDQRTQELVDEKKKTDALLYNMLPPVIAESLKLGRHVAPEMVENSTVFFSDIVGFTLLAAKSSPLEIVVFLNDLYTMFDEIIGKYDVYKVETIGDAYMVVSGVPVRNGDKHITEIADMSLDIMSSVMTFKIAHFPEKSLQARVGINTGPCAAGVVGHTMPRYCLFGDTINTASRMESTGLACKIQLSPNAYGALIQHRGYKTVERGVVEIKGKGKVITHWLEGRDDFSRPLPKPTDDTHSNCSNLQNTSNISLDIRDSMANTTFDSEPPRNKTNTTPDSDKLNNLNNILFHNNEDRSENSNKLNENIM